MIQYAIITAVMLCVAFAVFKVVVHATRAVKINAENRKKNDY